MFIVMNKAERERERVMWTQDLDLDSAGPTKSGENLEQSDGRGYQ